MVSVSPRGVDEGTAVTVAPAKALGHAHIMAIWSGRGNVLSLRPWRLGGGEGRGEVGDSGPSPAHLTFPRRSLSSGRALRGPVGRGPLAVSVSGRQKQRTTVKIPCYGWLFFAVIPPPRLPKTQHFRGSGRSAGCYS